MLFLYKGAVIISSYRSWLKSGGCLICVTWNLEQLFFTNNFWVKMAKLSYDYDYDHDKPILRYGSLAVQPFSRYDILTNENFNPQIRS